MVYTFLNEKSFLYSLYVLAFIVITFCDAKQCNQFLCNFFAKKSYPLENQKRIRSELDSFIFDGKYSRELKEEFESDFSAWYDLLMEYYSAPEIVTALEKQYKDNFPFLAQRLAKANIFKPSTRNIKTVGIVYNRYYEGGVERVISLHIPVLLKMGYSVVLIVNESNPEMEYLLPLGVKKGCHSC